MDSQKMKPFPCPRRRLGKMTITADFMLEAIKLVKSKTNKKIALNTNIHPVDIDRLKENFGPIYKELGSQMVLGMDAYPSQEMVDPRLSGEMANYGELIDRVREPFPEAEIICCSLEQSRKKRCPHNCVLIYKRIEQSDGCASFICSRKIKFADIAMGSETEVNHLIETGSGKVTFDCTFQNLVTGNPV